MPNFNDWNNEKPIGLVQGQMRELCSLFGVPCYYLPKKHRNLCKTFGEDDLMNFDEAYEIMLLPEDPAGWGGSGDRYGNFGMEILDTMEMYIEKGIFEEITGLSIPAEDDLIFIPYLGNSWFQIGSLGDDRNGSQPFHWHSKNLAWRLSLFKYQFSHEDIDTDIDDIQDFLPSVDNQTDRDNDNVKDDAKKWGLEDEFDALLK